MVEIIKVIYSKLDLFINVREWVRLAFAFLCFFNLVPSQGTPIKIESFFQPAAITLSNSTTYKVIIEGTQSQPKGKMPKISGLNISNNPQTYRRVSLINGQTSIKLELSFATEPTRQGQFTFPSWEILIDGVAHSVPPAKLDVLPSSKQDIAVQNQRKQRQDDLRKAAFIEFSLPRDYIFEGESIVSKINLFLWDEIPFTRIENAPVKSGDAFSMSALGQPLESRNIVRFNKSYSTYSWNAGLTAAIVGEHSLSFHSNVRMRSSNRKSSPFNSPFFNDPFFGFGREESIRVHSPEKKILVKPLPMIGRPPSFSGAIGRFATSLSIDAERVSEGDPIRLTFSISGKGNFAAMPAPSLDLDENFKVGAPAFSFSGDQETKFEGTQNFEYVITPLNAGILRLPSVNFSFFDPVSEEYQISQIENRSIRVDPGEKWIEEKSMIKNEKNKSPAVSTSDLFQTQSEPGIWLRVLKQPRFSSSSTFWILQLVPFCFTSLLIVWGIKRKSTNHENLKHKESKLLKKFKTCHSVSDTKGFFRCYRNLIQLKITQITDHPNPSSLSSEELVSLLRESIKNNKLVEKIGMLLRKFDDIEFAGNAHTQVNLKQEYKKALRLFKMIK